MSAFAGEDQTVQRIREVASGTFDICGGKTQSQWKSCWNDACLAVALEMESEGLMTTAEEARKLVGMSKRIKP